MFETTWDIAGKHIVISSEYMGDQSWARDEYNTNRNEIILEIDGEEESSDIWGSMACPQFDDEDSVRTAIATLAEEALDYIQDEFDDITYDMSPEDAKSVIDGCEELASKFETLGLYEDELIEIANSNR